MAGIEYKVRECPLCFGPFDDIQRLECDHMLCNLCMVECTVCYDGEFIVTCPYEKCKEKSNRELAQKLEHFDQAKYDTSPFKRFGKAMEDDLRATAEEFGLKNKDYHGDEEKRIKQVELRAQLGIQRGVEALSLAQNTTPSCPDQAPKPAPTVPQWTAMFTLDKLWDNADQCEEILGFYENETGEKIIIDVNTGKVDRVMEFLKEKFADELENDKFEIVEQKSDTNYLVAIGAKIAANPEVTAYIDSHPDSLRDPSYFGTVSCLGVDQNGKLYILTTKHIFGEAQTPQQEVGCFISSHGSKLQRVSNYYRGILSGVRVDTRIPQLIDIAALPLVPGIENELEPYLIHDLKDMYIGTEGQVRQQLQNMVVFKNGAVSGCTCGEVIIPNYFNRKHNIKGCCFVVRSRNNDQAFAQKGDSGSLIWTQSGKPLGIVSYHDECVRYNGEDIRATYGVRLDYCLGALRDDPDINLNIVKCKAYGSPIPVIRQDEPAAGGFQAASAEPV